MIVGPRIRQVFWISEIYECGRSSPVDTQMCSILIVFGSLEVFVFITFISLEDNLICHLWRSHDDIQIKLSLETFFDDLHMQEPEKSASETMPKSRGDFIFRSERTIVELELLDIFAQLVVVGCIYRIYASKDKWSNFLKPWYWLWRRLLSFIYRISHLSLMNGFDPTYHISYLSTFEGLCFIVFRLEAPHLEYLDSLLRV